MQRFMIVLEGRGWEDLEDMELPSPPSQGEPLETKYGTCFVTKVEPAPDLEHYDAKVFCRVP